MALQCDHTLNGAGDQTPALSVSAAMALAKGALEGVVVRLVGEVSELSNKPGYKAVYFSVKDQSASLPCMIWNNRYQSSGVQMRVGMLVELTGRFSLYTAKGRMNFDVFSITLAGEGNLRMQVAELARRLSAEGLMAPERKRPIPAYPERIGVVTSPRGAAVHDVLRTLRRRYPLAQIVLAGVPVEGVQAPRNLCDGLRCVVAAGVDVVLLVRGGGSFEDLMPFNDEGLARMVAACPVPLVTGIGHEPDTTISDMVSDLRASTPTAAAEAVAPQKDALLGELDRMARSMAAAMRARLNAEQIRFERQMHRGPFGDPARLIADDALKLDDLSTRLSLAIPHALQTDKRRLVSLGSSLGASLVRELQSPRQRVSSLTARLVYRGEHFCERYQSRLSMNAARLNDLSPLAVLGRGFAIARNEDGALVRSVESLSSGDAIDIEFADGKARCSVDLVFGMLSSGSDIGGCYE